MFADVSATYWAAAWIERLVGQGLASGCGAGRFCLRARPRAARRPFLVNSFDIPL
jgi:hypothetical protein